MVAYLYCLILPPLSTPTLPAGKGKYTWGVNGAVYVGDYDDNKKQGKGQLTYPDKGVYVGELLLLSGLQGKSSLGDVCIWRHQGCSAGGRLWQGIRAWSGQPMCRNASASDPYVLHPHVCPAGGFVGDQAEGQGTYTYSNGDIYMGEFKAGKRHGNGAYHFKVGSQPCLVASHNPSCPPATASFSWLSSNSQYIC